MESAIQESKKAEGSHPREPLYGGFTRFELELEVSIGPS
jgi:hypothetical protein